MSSLVIRAALVFETSSGKTNKQTNKQTAIVVAVGNDV